MRPSTLNLAANPTFRQFGFTFPDSRLYSNLQTESIAPGRCCLYAEYLISEQLIDSALGLPKDKASVAKGRIAATPTPIEITDR
jgi:hypothetical protein